MVVISRVPIYSDIGSHVEPKARVAVDIDLNELTVFRVYAVGAAIDVREQRDLAFSVRIL